MRAHLLPDPLMNLWIGWITAVKHLAETEVDLDDLAHAVPMAITKLRGEAAIAQEQLRLWIEALEKCHVAA